MFSLNSNIEQVIERFKGYKAKLANTDPSEALLVGVNAARGQMSFRIFNEGKDAEGNSFGIYTGQKARISKRTEEKLFKGKKKDFLVGQSAQFTEYEIIRLKKGRQIRYKDLEFSGTLRRGIVVVRETNKRVLCTIPNDSLAKLAEYQEEQIGRIKGGDSIIIFSLSEEERNLMKTNIRQALKQLYDRVLSS